MRRVTAIAGCVLAGTAALCAVAQSGCERRRAPGDAIAGAEVLGGLGDTAGRFVYPRCLDAGTDGLWVIDRSARVQRFDRATRLCTGVFKTPEHENGKPTGLFVGPGAGEGGAWAENLLYIADTHYHRVLVYQAPPAPEEPPTAGAPKLTPSLVRTIGRFGRGAGEFIYPTDVAVEYTPDGLGIERIFVSEYGGNDRVSVFDADGRFVKSFGQPGSAGEAGVRFSRPQSMALIGPRERRRLVVADLANHRIGVFTLDGELVRWVGSDASAGQPVAMPDTINPPEAAAAGAARAAEIGRGAMFLYPIGLEGLDDGSVLVTEFGAARVQRVDVETGETLGAWGRPGRSEGELAAPWASIVVGATIYALDSGNNRILRFSAPGVRREQRRQSPAAVGGPR